MTKSVRFIRHYYKLESPYLDGKDIPSKCFSDLSLGNADPSIHPDFVKEATRIYSKDAFSNIELILTSPLKRVRETAEVLKAVFDIPGAVHTSQNLTEIFWDPASIMSELGVTTMADQNKPAVFNMRVKRFLDLSAPKTLIDALVQLNGLRGELTAYPQTHVLCVTHSFFLRLIKLYFVDNKRSGIDFTENLLLKTRSEDLKITV